MSTQVPDQSRPTEEKIRWSKDELKCRYYKGRVFYFAHETREWYELDDEALLLYYQCVASGSKDGYSLWCDEDIARPPLYDKEILETFGVDWETYGKGGT